MFSFDPERVTFAMVSQRLCSPGSDLQGSGWVETVEAPGFEKIALQYLYRTTGFLAEVRDDLECKLFERNRDLFTQELDMVFWIPPVFLSIARRRRSGASVAIRETIVLICLTAGAGSGC